jgi:hypothetical protein
LGCSPESIVLIRTHVVAHAAALHTGAAIAAATKDAKAASVAAAAARPAAAASKPAAPLKQVSTVPVHALSCSCADLLSFALCT